MTRWRVQVEGVVQGVGFRPFAHHLAHELGLDGWIRNTSAGVEMELQGAERSLAAFVGRLRHEAPPLAHIQALATTEMPTLPARSGGLEIRPSQNQDGRTLLSPDAATCPACLEELFDPADRRCAYPFTNCTHCGPRYTIVTGLPYDRPLTTMAGFPMCPACDAEYHRPEDRRFHAQPIACPDCGPRLWYVASGGRQSPAEGDAALAAAAFQLAQGGIVAVKGLGGFHLAGRADDGRAVRRLRAVKGRPDKALAVMVRDVPEAMRYARVGPAERELLQSREAPIVLLRKWSGSARLADEVSPHNPAIGLLLPYTPLHHLLLRAVALPLVMTSGNDNGEPLCIENEQALAELVACCDGFLLHDRPIARRCDDSVLFVAALDQEAAVQPVRRGRGYAPRPLRLPAELALSAPLLAVGADLKNAAALAEGRQVFLTPHIGNLSNPNTRAEQARAIADFEQLFRLRPRVIVCDLHPDYASSRYARGWAEREGLRLLEVQHHHAHVAGCLAENDYGGPAIGLAFDGTGYGSDGRIWGGEALLVEGGRFERACHLEYLPLPGGDAAVRQPYRLAAAYLWRLLPEADVMALLPEAPAVELAVVQALLAGQLSTPLTSSMGRLFDAVSALLGLCQRASYEAQAAIALENAATAGASGGAYPFVLEEEQIRLGPLLAAIVAERQAGTPIADIARRFHETVAEMAVAAAEVARQRHGGDGLPVALSGGVWQNRLLLELAVPRLRRAGFKVLLHREAPANDGGLAYGQTAVAAAWLRGTAGSAAG